MGSFIAPKVSAKRACILTEMGYCYGVCLVTVIMVGARRAHFFGSNCDDGLIAVIGVQYKSDRTKCKLVTLFDSYSCDGVTAGIWVLQTGPKSGGSW